MIILDLFAGEGGERRRAKIEARLHTYITVDIEPRFGCSITADILADDFLDRLWVYCDSAGIDCRFDFLWASIPCEGFSVASIGHHWTGGKRAYVPRTDTARLGIRLLERTAFLRRQFRPTAWLFENPRGVMRKMAAVAYLPRHTVTYCRYGDTRMKPTDLWGEVPGWTPRPMCHNGHPDHERAPRGAKTGTQGIKGAAGRAVVPWGLWEEILNCLEAA